MLTAKCRNNVEITEFCFRLNHVKVGQPSDTFIELVPFICGSISKLTLKYVRVISTGWGEFQKKGIVC